MTIYWITLRHHATQHVRTYEFTTPLARAMLVISTSGYAEVVDQGERDDDLDEGREDDRDEAYERAAARARGDDFAATGGKDWT